MRILIFGTVYCDTTEKYKLAQQWVELHRRINPSCDLVLVDSSSPIALDALNEHAQVLQMGDNIGHLSRGGKDGWGRAFCEGMTWALQYKYDWIVHIEGDSLCRLNIERICKFADRQGIDAMSVPVRGTKRDEKDWIETGIMMLRAPFVRRHRLIEMYDWKDCDSKRYPYTPEWVLRYLLGHHLTMGSWRNIRDDVGIVTPQNVHDYDWISHTTPEVYDAFITSVLEHA